uniref:Reverse transcriptase domain-containing protein n=1 Tax=Hucho hucho TaxID=62062 RepID=A0A4W5LF61_9TELE
MPELARAFADRWRATEPFNGLGQFRAEGGANNGEFEHLISAGEVYENLKEMKKGTAAGPDGVTRERLLSWDPNGAKLACLFSMWLVTGALPSTFKECRTTLIPKTPNPVERLQIGGWRPITISSVVARLFSRIITARLARACPISPRQRGFISAPGCSENLMLLQGLIRQSRKQRTPLAVVFVDFAKAFDSVSHEHLQSVLEQRGLDRHIMALIGSTYEKSTTRITIDGVRSSVIDMSVGVKQGDPMSPLLFNLALDPLVQTLERYGSGVGSEGCQTTTLAFADDLVLLSSSVKGMGLNIAILEQFCQLTGLRVQPRKCHSFFIEKGGNGKGESSVKVNNCPAWKLNGEDIHMIGQEESEKYLGMQVSPRAGIVKPELTGPLREWIDKIGRAALKPSQKVKMLNSFAVPRLIYKADHGNLKTVDLTKIDGMIRNAVKGWLHLPPSTCNGLLYAKHRDGGLGIVKLARQIPSIQARRIHRLWHSADECTRRITRSTVEEAEFEGTWRRAGGSDAERPSLGENPTSSVTPRCPIPSDWRQEEMRQWIGLATQGIGTQAFGNDKTSNSWLANPYSVRFKQGQYIDGLKLRANVYPTREMLARGRPEMDPSCRRCPAPYESCTHILGQCPSIQGARI